jgi:peptidyl-dipeptidase Dcp
MNPFLTDFNTPYDTAPFDKITVDHYLPAIKEGIKLGLAEIDAIVDNSEPATFTNTIEALENYFLF